MKQVSINAYEFNELDDEAKYKVKEYFNDFEMFYQSEAEESLNKFCIVFDIKWQEWDIFRNYVNYNFLNDDVKNLSYVRLYKYIQNNVNKKYYKDCNSLTGVYWDNELLNPIIEFMKKPYNVTFQNLLNDCLKNWIVSVESEYNYMQSDDYMKEICIGNNYLFTKSGTLI
tara:strand:+ start:41 stop:550 length:510 start_codon:yes stop_codon:yes gene_type:complete